MSLVLLIGDLHIPHRAVDVPAKFKELLPAGRFAHVLCTGNLCDKETLDWIRSLTSDAHVVKGPFDTDQSFLEAKVVTIAGWKFGLTNGYQIVPMGDQQSWVDVAKMLDCDVLVCGYSHISAVLSSDGKFCINPGSASGAYNTLSSTVTPSFCVLAVNTAEITVYVYHLTDDKVEVAKATISR